MITERGFVDERSRYIHEFTGQLCRWDQQGTVELAGLYELVPPLPRYRDLDALEFSWYLCRCDSLLAVNHRRVLNLQDRKSTRLNSSHPSISYAVFCLK